MTSSADDDDGGGDGGLQKKCDTTSDCSVGLSTYGKTSARGRRLHYEDGSPLSTSQWASVDSMLTFSSLIPDTLTRRMDTSDTKTTADAARGNGASRLRGVQRPINAPPSGLFIVKIIINPGQPTTGLRSDSARRRLEMKLMRLARDWMIIGASCRN